METISKELQATMPTKPHQEMTSILITIPSQWVQQMDAIADFYCKSRMTIIRDFIQQGIKEISQKYANRHQELEAMNKIFDEMTERTKKFEETQKELKERW